MTDEVDDIDAAWADITAQIDFSQLGAAAVGIISCYADFIESGLVAELSRRLPFESIGVTTISSSANGELGAYSLVLAIITGDNLEFSVAATSPLDHDSFRQSIAAAYAQAAGRLVMPPVFAIAFLPFLREIGGAEIVQALDEAAAGLPLWGGIASGNDMSYSGASTFVNGADDPAIAALLLVAGDIEPQFVVTSVPDRNVTENKALITRSHDCVMEEIDGVPAVEYFASVGIEIDMRDATTIPMMVDYGDGSKPVALAMYSATPDGHILCGGFVPAGATVSIADVDDEGILDTAAISLDELLAFGKTGGLLVMPCITRYIMLAPAQERELRLVAERLGSSIPYYQSYSGGEVCPTLAADGLYHNRFHNYTFSACIF